MFDYINMTTDELLKAFSGFTADFLHCAEKHNEKECDEARKFLKIITAEIIRRCEHGND